MTQSLDTNSTTSLPALKALQSVVLVFTLSALTVSGAWAFELLGGYLPCPLCLMQRWAYYFVAPLTLVLLLPFIARRISLVRLGLVICALAMVAGGGLGVYHAGVEWEFWPGPQSCSGGGGLSGGLPDLSTAKVVRCDEVQWRMFGLSFAGWNVVVSLLIAAIALRGAAVGQGSSSVSQ